MNWMLIGLAVMVAVFLFKFKEIKHKLGFFVIAFLLIFLVFSGLHLYSTQNLDLNSFDGLSSAIKIYFSWLGGIAKNFVDITGYAIENHKWGLNESKGR